MKMSNNNLLNYLKEKTGQAENNTIADNSYVKVPKQSENTSSEYKTSMLIKHLGRDSGLEEKVEELGDVVEKVMNIVLKFPDWIDEEVKKYTLRINDLENQVNTLSSNVNYLKGNSGTPSFISQDMIPMSPLAAPKPAPRVSPVSLRGAINQELKDIFAKRKKIE